MKRISKVLFLLGIVAALTACGQKSDPAGNLAKDISIDADSLKGTEKGSDRDDAATEAADQQKSGAAEGMFSFIYEGATLTPGELVDHSVLPKCSDVSEVPSCAFGGNDKVYNYGVFELTTYFDEDEERVYSIYFLDPNLPTTEGLCLGDSVDDMIALYGEAYEAEENAYTYTRGETLLMIVTKNDMVVSMEYRLDR